jgi:hypothetical protein
VKLVGANVTALQVDVTKLEDLDRVADAVQSAKGKVHVCPREPKRDLNGLGVDIDSIFVVLGAPVWRSRLSTAIPKGPGNAARKFHRQLVVGGRPPTYPQIVGSRERVAIAYRCGKSEEDRRKSPQGSTPQHHPRHQDAPPAG